MLASSWMRCPQCNAALEPNATLDRLDCRGCALTYPVRDGVPALVIGEAVARPIDTDPEFERLVAEAIEAPFSGCDLSWLDGRCSTHTDLTAQYETRAKQLMAQASAVLELGTGGGERFARFAPFPPLAVATESYPPNVTVVQGRLAPLGVQIIRTDPETHNAGGPQPGNRWPQRRLPLADVAFDLVLAHRSAFSPNEVARVLRPGGTLLTVQGGAEWRGETLADALQGTPPDWTIPGHGWDVGESFRQSGLRIVDWTEQATPTTYADIRAVVYLLLHVPWAVVDFDLDRYRERLYRLHQRIQREGTLMTYGYSRLIEARKP